MAFGVPLVAVMTFFLNWDDWRERPWFWWAMLGTLAVVAVSVLLARGPTQRGSRADELAQRRFQEEVVRPALVALRPGFGYEPQATLPRQDFDDSLLFYDFVGKFESGHRIQGTLAGLPFEMHETVARTPRGEPDTPMLKGSFVRLDLPFEVRQQLRIRSRTGWPQARARATIEPHVYLSLGGTRLWLALDRQREWFEITPQAAFGLGDLQGWDETFDLIEGLAREIAGAGPSV